MTQLNNKTKFDFNKSIANLEKIVQTMEAGDLSLESALKNYEKGITLVRECQVALNQAEQKIALLSKQDNYQNEQPFEVED